MCRWQKSPHCTAPSGVNCACGIRLESVGTGKEVEVFCALLESTHIASGGLGLLHWGGRGGRLQRP